MISSSMCEIFILSILEPITRIDQEQTEDDDEQMTKHISMRCTNLDEGKSAKKTWRIF